VWKLHHRRRVTFSRDSTQLIGSTVDLLEGDVICDGASEELETGTQVGDYEITRLLGTGGMGTVYAARHPVIGKEVAVKVVNRRLSGDDEVAICQRGPGAHPDRSRQRRRGLLVRRAR
jgi:serine/threonine protein kinase